MSEKIFLVDSGTNISKLEQKIQEFPQNTIYALSYEIHKVLEKKEIPHKLADDILISEDFKKIDSFSINFTKNCFDKYKKLLTFEGIYLPELLELELFQYLLIQYLKPYVILKIIQNNNIELIIDFTIYDDFIKKIINSKNIHHIHFENLETDTMYHDKIKFAVNLFNLPIHIQLSRKTFSKIKKFTQKFSNQIFDLKPNINSKENILLVNFDPLQYGELLTELNNESTNFLLLNTRKPAITNKKSLYIKRNILIWSGKKNNKLSKKFFLILNILKKFFVLLEFHFGLVYKIHFKIFVYHDLMNQLSEYYFCKNSLHHMILVLFLCGLMLVKKKKNVYELENNFWLALLCYNMVDFKPQRYGINLHHL